MATGLIKQKADQLPFRIFSSCGFDSDQLYPVLHHGIVVLDMAGFKVDAVLSDGVSPNGRFYRIHKFADESNQSEDGVLYWMWNRFDRA